MTAERPHGYARYKLDGCRCEICTTAAHEYNHRRDRGILYGTWEPFIEAQPVRDHIKALSEAGIGRRRLVQLSGVSGSTVKKLLYGRKGAGIPPTARIRPEIASRILAVRPGDRALADHALIDATGSLRRLQALVANGWPQRQLAFRLGMQPTNLGAVMGRDQITAATARQIAALYIRLENADPRAHGVDNQAYSRAVNQGLRNRWARPPHWDEGALDDPEAFPDWTGECGTMRGYTIHRRDKIPICDPCRSVSSEDRERRRSAAMAAP